MPSVATFVRMRAIAERYLPDTVTIYRPPDPATATHKPSGAIDDTYPAQWQTVATTNCRVTESRLSGIENMGAGKMQATGFYDVQFPFNTAIDETCRFRVTASTNNPQLVGLDFDVKAAQVSNYAIQRVVQASKTLR